MRCRGLQGALSALGLCIALMLGAPGASASSVGKGGQWYFHQAAAPGIHALMRGDSEPGLHDGEIARVEVQPSRFVVWLNTPDDQPASHQLVGELEGPGWAAAPTLRLFIQPTDPAPPEALKARLDSLYETVTSQARPERLRRLAEVNTADLSAEPGGPFGWSLGLSPAQSAMGWLMFGLLWFIIRLRGVRGVRSLIQNRVIPTTHLLDLICLIALWIRLLAVDFAIFGADEVGFFETIWRAAQAGVWPIYGPAISGGAAYTPGGAFFYILAPMAWLGDDPRMAGQLVAVFSVITIRLWASLIGQLWGPRAALLFALLISVHPWSIAYANRAWPSCLMVWLSALCLYGAYPSVMKQRPAWGVAAIVLLLALPQVHLSAPIVWAVVLTWWLIAKHRPSRRQLGLGLAGGLLVYLPYLLLEWRQDFSNTLGIVQGGRSAASSVIDAISDGALYLVLLGTTHIGELMHGGYADGLSIRWQIVTAEGWSDLYSRLDPLSATVALLTVMMSVVGWMMAGRMTITGPKGEQRTLCIGLMTGVTAALTLLALRGSMVFPHYVNALLILLMLPMVLTFDRLFAQAHSSMVRLPLIALLGLTMVGSSLGTVRYHSEVASRSSIPTILSVASHIGTQTQGEPFTIDLGGYIEPEALAALSTKVLHRSFKASASSDYHFRLVLSADSTHAQGLSIGDLRLVREATTNR